MGYIIIPDVHGQTAMLGELIHILEASGKLTGRTLAFLGDYVDRGPNAKGTVELVRELAAQGHIAIAGNHDVVLSKVLDPRTYDWPIWVKRWANNYEDGTCTSYGVRRPEGPFCTATLSAWLHTAQELRRAIPQKHQQFINDLPWYYEDESFVLIHAGLTREDWNIQRENLRNRVIGKNGPAQIFSHKLATRDDYDYPIPPRCVVSGHGYVSRPLLRPYRARLNCGADVGGPLIAWVTDTGEVIQTNARSANW